LLSAALARKTAVDSAPGWSQCLAASPNTGVNTITGEELKETMIEIGYATE